MTLTLALLLVGCELPEPIERNCLHRQAFYPDPDGDGIGDPSEVFIGCEAPAGWVSVLETPGGSGGSGATTTTPTALTGDTGSTTVPTATTGDTGLPMPTGSTGAAHTATTADTGPIVDTSDTGAPPGGTGSTGDTGP